MMKHLFTCPWFISSSSTACFACFLPDLRHTMNRKTISPLFLGFDWTSNDVIITHSMYTLFGLKDAQGSIIR